MPVASRTTGCASPGTCRESFWADSFDRIIVHLNRRDISMAAVSKAPLATLETFKKRMGWSFKWVSSLHNGFNRDYHVSFTPEEQATATYNYKPGGFGSSEAPGISVFAKGENGGVFHTYSCYARGLDALNSAYQLLDLVPKGATRTPCPMRWPATPPRQVRRLRRGQVPRTLSKTAREWGPIPSCPRVAATPPFSAACG